MNKKLSQLSTRLKVAALLVTAAGLLCTGAVQATEVQWDEQATLEVTHALHQLHEVWNTGDIGSLKQYLVGDDVLVTFELDPVTHEPIRLGSKQAIDQFVDAIVNDLDNTHAISELGEPTLHCRATKEFAVCTEECNISIKLADGVEERHKLRATNTAVKTDDGWKWIQWHMSVAAPSETYKNGQLVASK